VRGLTAGMLAGGVLAATSARAEPTIRAFTIDGARDQITLTLTDACPTSAYTFVRCTSLVQRVETPLAVRLGSPGGVTVGLALSHAAAVLFCARESSGEDFDGDGVANLDEFRRNIDPENPDTDADGMRDGWEVVHGLDPRCADDAGGDADSDGLTNRQEHDRGTNPNQCDSDGDLVADGADANPASAADLDGDGLPDDWEVFWFGQTIEQNGAGDPDGDGRTNRQEYGAGTDPTRANGEDATNENRLLVFLPVR